MGNRNLLLILMAQIIAWPVLAESSSRLAPDAAVRDRLTARLAASGSLRESDVKVTVENGAVTLNGRVASQYARERALRIASRTSGVERVTSNLVISTAKSVGSTPVPDSELARRVAEALASQVLEGKATTRQDWIYGWEVKGGTFEFDVEVDDGDVTLDGEAPSPVTARALVNAARSVAGVRSVFSMLYIDEHGHGRFSSALGYPDVPYYYNPYHP